MIDGDARLFVFGTNSGVFAVDPETAKFSWEWRASSEVRRTIFGGDSSPAGDKLMGFRGQGSEDTLFILDAATGSLVRTIGTIMQPRNMAFGGWLSNDRVWLASTPEPGNRLLWWESRSLIDDEHVLLPLGYNGVVSMDTERNLVLVSRRDEITIYDEAGTILAVIGEGFVQRVGHLPHCRDRGCELFDCVLELEDGFVSVDLGRCEP